MPNIKDYGLTHIAITRQTNKKIDTYRKENRGTLKYDMVDKAIDLYIKVKEAGK